MHGTDTYFVNRDLLLDKWKVGSLETCFPVDWPSVLLLEHTHAIRGVLACLSNFAECFEQISRLKVQFSKEKERTSLNNVVSKPCKRQGNI